MGPNPCLAASCGCCQKQLSWNFLVVQWLRLHTPSAGAWVQSLVEELDPTGCNEDQRSYLLQDVVQPPNAFFKQKKIEPKSRKEFYALQMARVGEGLGCHSL